MSDSLWPHEPQHARPPCPSPTPGVHPNLCPLSQWYHPTISSSVVPFSLLPSIFPSIRVFSNESALCIRWPKYWSFSFKISPTNEHSGLISLGWTGWISLQSKGLSTSLESPNIQYTNTDPGKLLSACTSHSLAACSAKSRQFHINCHYSFPNGL